MISILARRISTEVMFAISGTKSILHCLKETKDMWLFSVEDDEFNKCCLMDQPE